MTAATQTNASKDQSLRIAGGKVGVLLLHGLCGTPAEMRFVAMGLARAGYTVHAPQLAGHGDDNSGRWQDWYLSARAALTEIRKECDTVIVGGLCMGAILGLHLAARNPGKVQGVSLFSPTLWINGWAMPRSMRLFQLVRHEVFNVSPFFGSFLAPKCVPLGYCDEDRNRDEHCPIRPHKDNVLAAWAEKRAAAKAAGRELATI